MQTIIKGAWTYRVASPIEQCVYALRELAQYVRTNSAFFVRHGPQMLTPSETEARQQGIKELASEIEKLAKQLEKLPVTTPPPQGTVNYQSVETILSKLREHGFYPDNLLISNVARAFVTAGL